MMNVIFFFRVSAEPIAKTVIFRMSELANKTKFSAHLDPYDIKFGNLFAYKITH